MFWNLFTFRGHSTLKSDSSRAFCGSTQKQVLAKAGTGKKSTKQTNSGEVSEKNASEWTGRVEISKEEILGSKRSMHGYMLTYYRL